MRLISFDIGIKNMAFCCFDLSGSHVSIKEWNVLNLMEEETIKETCSCLLKAKNKQSVAALCGRNAKFKKVDKLYCEKHAKASADYKIPTKEYSQTSLNKMKVEQLRELCTKHGVAINGESKAGILHLLQAHFSSTCFDLIIEKKKKAAGDTDLITIGKNMKQIFGEIENMNSADIVVIENQISPIANRMKTIQGMLAQYFIMKNTDTCIEFVSSSNKLKDFVPLENTLQEGETTYKKNKKNGVEYCSQMLSSNKEFEKWSHVLNTKKKDDLADCFLQGHWYIYKKLIKK
jgi:hypothetical protein